MKVAILLEKQKLNCAQLHVRNCMCVRSNQTKIENDYWVFKNFSKLEMSDLRQVFTPSQTPEVTDKFRKIIPILRREWDMKSVQKPDNRTTLLIITKNAIETVHTYAWLGEKTYASLILHAHPIRGLKNSIKLYFRNEENLPEIVKAFDEAMEAARDWIY